jgi:undecaprenyl-diphosphatase
MDLMQIIFLGLVQGITEFLPVSSSGHLHLFQFFFRLTPSLTLDIFLNTATLFSVIFFFRHQLKFFFSNLKYIIVGTIPAVIAGFFAKDYINQVFIDPKSLIFTYLFTTVLLFSTHFLKKSETQITYKKAFIVGLFQALAILPGVSRSASTIVASLILGLSPAFAFKFSFALFIPVSIGALILGLSDFNSLDLTISSAAIAFIITFFVGLISLKLLKNIVIGQKLKYFGFYTLFLFFLLLALT